MAGSCAETAMWATSVGNEYGQVLNCLLTIKEFGGIKSMVRGLVHRYKKRGKAAPSVLYTNRDCCSSAPGQPGKVQQMFIAWPDLNVCLNIGHFMRWLAVGCSTYAHQLHGTFMAMMASCILELDPMDMVALQKAKKAELISQPLHNPSDASINKHLTKKEVQLHYQKGTRGSI